MSPHTRRAGVLGLALAVSLISQQCILAQPNDPRPIPPPVPRIDGAQPNPADTPQAGMEVLGRGPIHEAFAQPNGNAKPGAVIPKQPPEPIAEEPPSQRPQGDNVEWIPGYWAWDPSRSDYLWVSGVWRNEPPGRKWVPGHWTQADNGWRWVSGLWADASLQTLQYMAEKPPDSLDNGPSVPAPDDNSLWVAGHWEWRDGQFVWRPGYWADGQQGMVWNPADYYYTPSGYIYNTGYWDYVPDNRGLLFAPVYFTQPLWLNAGWRYRPWFYLGWNGLGASLWWGRGAYWFGDYYGGYFGYGFRPWYSFGLGFHDPLFNYYRWHYGAGFGRWYNGLHVGFTGRVNGSLERPAHTFASVNGRVSGNQLARPLSQFSGAKLTTMSTSQLAAHQNAAQQFRSFSQQRTQFEHTGTSTGFRSSASLNGLPGGRTSFNGNTGVRTSGYSPRFETNSMQHFNTQSMSQFGHSMNTYHTQSFRAPSHPGTSYSVPSFHTQSFNGYHTYSGGINSSSFGGGNHFSGGFSGGSHFSGGGHGGGGGGHGGGHR
jgi:hypothetical protein